MDKRIYLLTVISFVVGMVELIIGGILDLVASDLNISLGKAGLLITVFSLVYAIAAPILLIITAKLERKLLTLMTLFIFLLGNLVVVFSPNYAILMLARMITAASGSLLVVLCIVLASSIVPSRYIGRAVGLVIMGISGSLVLGVPIGLMLGHTYGWRAPFIMISVLTILLMLAVHFFMAPIQPEPSVPLKEQLRTLKRSKLLFAQMTTFLFLSGHITLYAFFTPFLNMKMGIYGTALSIIYFIYGIAAVAGGGIGGVLTDKFGARRVLIICISLFSLSTFLIPLTTFSIILFILIVIIWGINSWTITPAMQTYLIEIEPKTAAIQQSLNNSFLHFGIAFGSFVGSIVIEKTDVNVNAYTGAFFIFLALISVTISMKIKDGHSEKVNQHENS